MTQYQEVLFICATIQRDNGTYELGQVIASLIALFTKVIVLFHYS